MKFTLGVDREGQHFAHLGHVIPEDQVHILIAISLSYQYGIQKQILHSERLLPNECIEVMTIQRFKRSQAEKSVLVPSRCSIESRTGHVAP